MITTHVRKHATFAAHTPRSEWLKRRYFNSTDASASRFGHLHAIPKMKEQGTPHGDVPVLRNGEPARA
jgi:hypothetical protein